MRDSDFEAYVKTPGWNASLIKVAISESLAAAQHQRVNDIDTDTSNRKKLRAFHCAVLEGPAAFHRKFWVHDLDRSTNAFKHVIAAADDDIPDEDMHIIPRVARHLMRGQPLEPTFWTHKESRSTNAYNARAPGMAALGRVSVMLSELADAQALIPVAMNARGKTDIKTAEADTAHLVAGSIHAHRHAGRYFDGRQRVEQVVTWTDPQTGLPCKAMLDLLSPVDDGVLLDLKNLRGIKGRDVLWQFRSLLWGVQLAHYRDGCIYGLGFQPAKTGILGFTEKHGHVEVGIFWLDRLLKEGDDLRREALAQIAEAEKTGIWPGSQAEPENLDDYIIGSMDEEALDVDADSEFTPEGWSDR